MRIDAWRRLAPVLGVALFGAGWLAAPANAQEGGERVVLRAVDASDNENVRAVIGYSGDPSDLDGLEVRVNGDSVDATVADLAEAGMASNVVFVFDTSAGVEGNGLLAAAQDAISDIVETLPPGVEVGVVSAGGGSQIVQRMTTDSNEILDAIDDLNPAGDGAVLSGVIQGSALAGDASAVPTVVLVTDGVEEPATTFERAEGSLLAEGAALYVVGLQDGALDEAAFADLASRTGGRMVTTADAGEVGGLIDDVSPEAMSLRAALFASGQTEGVQDLAVAVNDASTTGSYVSGSSRIGFNRLLPIESVEGGGIAFFQSGIGRLLGFAAAALACVLFAYGVMLLFVRDQTTLSQALRPYADGYVAEPSEDDDGNQHLAQTALLQRAVAFTEQMAERRDLLTRLENSLERADLPLRAGEALFFYMAGVALVLLALLALTQNFMAMLVVGLIVALLPPGILNFLAARKKKQFEGLLPDTLQLLSSTLRAGYSMMQGVEAVSQEVAEPMGKELRRVVTEARLGRPLEESLDAVAERMGSKDFAWAVMAIRIQREVGGNLSELLLTVAETMTQRERLRRDVNSLTAEGRISAYVLIALPVGLGMFLYSVNPDYIGKLFDETLGQIMLGGAVIMVVVGYLWMMKIIKIEI